MTFLLVGLGLSKNSISEDAKDSLKSCEEIYLENYTINFPYSKKDLEDSLNKELIDAPRKLVESEEILDDAKESDIALLVYGDALSATTHSQLILSCIEKKIPYKIFPNASILNAIALAGLQPYKFGKTTSMPNWAEHKNRPTSFTEIIKQNQSISAHSLILTDIGLTLENALNQLIESFKKEDFPLKEKIIILSNAGTKSQKIFYDYINNLKSKDVSMPFCIIIPSKLHFSEIDFLQEVSS